MIYGSVLYSSVSNCKKQSLDDKKEVSNIEYRDILDKINQIVSSKANKESKRNKQDDLKSLKRIEFSPPAKNTRRHTLYNLKASQRCEESKFKMNESKDRRLNHNLFDSNSKSDSDTSSIINISNLSNSHEEISIKITKCKNVNFRNKPDEAVLISNVYFYPF